MFTQLNVFRSVLFSLLFAVSQLAFAEPEAQPNAAAADESLKYANGLSSAFEKVATVISPSVVTISSVKKVAPQKRMQGNPHNPFLDQFRDFFGDDFPDPFQPPEGYSQQGLGTGVVIDEAGHILTNNHVVGDADEVSVIFQDDQRFKAKVVGTDPKSDIAVIKIKASKKLVPAKLGDSDKLRIGEWVIAAGNPFGFTNSITAGIVSATGRSVSGGSHYEDFIQTDAAINPGNSGGPLCNLQGEVVGINTAIISRSGGYQGIGFAIPANLAKNVMESLIKTGKVVRGWLGVAIQDLNEDLAGSFNYPSTEGALVGSVQVDSPAQKAGMKQGDIIVKFGGEQIKKVNQLRNLVAAIKPGKSIPIDYIRDGRKETVDVKIGELPADEAPREVVDETSNDLGMSVESLTPEMASRLKSKQTKGVIVRAVRGGDIAEKAGVQVNDVIVSVNGAPISNLEEFKAAIGKANPKKGIRLVVETRGMERFVFLKSDEE